jgi:hypothetical protein
MVALDVLLATSGNEDQFQRGLNRNSETPKCQFKIAISQMGRIELVEFLDYKIYLTGLKFFLLIVQLMSQDLYCA